MEVSLSFVQGAGHVAHNEREFSRSNVDRSRSKDNIYRRTDESLEAAYQRIFGEAVQKYNEGQSRPDRHKTVEGYLEEIKVRQTNKNGEKPYYEVIVMLGDKDTTGIVQHPQEAAKAKDTLMEYLGTWTDRNPNLQVYSASLHMDEATPHLHIDYIPVADGYKRGLERRNSLSKALEQQGIANGGKMKENALTAWQSRERAYLSELALKRGLEVKIQGVQREHLSVQEYARAVERIEQEIQAIPEPGRKIGPITILTRADRATLRQQQEMTARQAAAMKLGAAVAEHQKELDQMKNCERSRRLDAREDSLDVKEISLNRLAQSLNERSREAEKIQEDLQNLQSRLSAQKIEQERRAQEQEARERSWSDEQRARADKRAADIAASRAAEANRKAAEQQKETAEAELRSAQRLRDEAVTDLIRVRDDLDTAKGQLASIMERERAVANGLQRIAAWDNAQAERERKQRETDQAAKDAEARRDTAEQQRENAAAELARITTSLRILREQAQREDTAAKARAAAREKEEKEQRDKLAQEIKAARAALKEEWAQLEKEKVSTMQYYSLAETMNKSIRDTVDWINIQTDQIEAKKRAISRDLQEKGFRPEELAVLHEVPAVDAEKARREMVKAARDSQINNLWSWQSGDPSISMTDTGVKFSCGAEMMLLEIDDAAKDLGGKIRLQPGARKFIEDRLKDKKPGAFSRTESLITEEDKKKFIAKWFDGSLEGSEKLKELEAANRLRLVKLRLERFTIDAVRETSDTLIRWEKDLADSRSRARADRGMER